MWGVNTDLIFVQTERLNEDRVELPGNFVYFKDKTDPKIETQVIGHD